MATLQTDVLGRAFRGALSPPPLLTISEWADRYGRLTSKTSATPGPWKSYPYQRAIMDAFCHPLVENVVCFKSKRIGWTKIIGNVIYYHIHQDPTPILVVHPTVNDSEKYSKQEIQTTVDETPELRALVGDRKSRDSSNTISVKEFPGGNLYMIGANSGTGFRQTTARVVLFDEVDGYPPTAGAEGDQISLGKGRSETYWNRKHGIGSTPTVKGESRIEAHWEGSSKGYPLLSCPHCGASHTRKFRQPVEPIIIRGAPVPVSHLQWDKGNPKGAAWVCPECGALIEQRHHKRLLDAMWWHGEHWDWHEDTGFTFYPGFDGTIGFRVWAGFSLNTNSKAGDIASEFLDTKDKPEEFIVFVNTVLGESWGEDGEQVNHKSLLARVETYPAEVPNGANYLSAGVDLQGDRIELEIVGWGSGEESWSVDYIVLPGDPAQDEVWKDLADALRATYTHEQGVNMDIQAICIDRGYLPQRVDTFIAGFRAQYCWGVNGRSGFHRPVVETKEKRARRLRKMRRHATPREIVGVDDAKLILQRRLRGVTKPGPGYCHFGEHCDGEYFAQLTGEKLLTHYKRDGPHYEWIRTRPRVEVLDCRNYAYAAMLLADPDLNTQVKPPPKQEKKKQGKLRPPRRNNYVGSW